MAHTPRHVCMEPILRPPHNPREALVVFMDHLLFKAMAIFISLHTNHLLKPSLNHLIGQPAMLKVKNISVSLILVVQRCAFRDGRRTTHAIGRAASLKVVSTDRSCSPCRRPHWQVCHDGRNLSTGSSSHSMSVTRFMNHHDDICDEGFLHEKKKENNGYLLHIKRENDGYISCKEHDLQRFSTYHEGCYELLSCNLLQYQSVYIQSVTKSTCVRYKANLHIP